MRAVFVSSVRHDSGVPRRGYYGPTPTATFVHRLDVPQWHRCSLEVGVSAGGSQEPTPKGPDLLGRQHNRCAGVLDGGGCTRDGPGGDLSLGNLEETGGSGAGKVLAGRPRRTTGTTPDPERFPKKRTRPLSHLNDPSEGSLCDAHATQSGFPQFSPPTPPRPRTVPQTVGTRRVEDSPGFFRCAERTGHGASLGLERWVLTVPDSPPSGPRTHGTGIPPPVDVP